MMECLPHYFLFWYTLTSFLRQVLFLLIPPPDPIPPHPPPHLIQFHLVPPPDQIPPYSTT